MVKDKIEFYRSFGSLSNDIVVTDIYKKRIKANKKRKNRRNKYDRRRKESN